MEKQGLKKDRCEECGKKARKEAGKKIKHERKGKKGTY
jgi:hypothetical protein